MGNVAYKQKASVHRVPRKNRNAAILSVSLITFDRYGSEMHFVLLTTATIHHSMKCVSGTSLSKVLKCICSFPPFRNPLSDEVAFCSKFS